MRVGAKDKDKDKEKEKEQSIEVLHLKSQTSSNLPTYQPTNPGILQHRPSPALASIQ